MDKRNKICYIAGAMELEGDIAPLPGDLVIAADKGLERLQRRGIEPDLIVGDFDSLGCVPEGGNVVRHPVMKDDTDMMLAAEMGLQAGYRTFVLCGGFGGRPDHTMGNMHTLIYLARRGARGYLPGGGMTATAIENGAIGFKSTARGNLSVFSAGDCAEGVTLRGLKYELTDARLPSGVTLGVSNEFTGAESRVEVRSGALLIMWSGGVEAVKDF
ncbi:MAG: thiamine diphosphokinase [Clostridia bacterium]|nr:thiamine diphosphokinase [Clostridia bacterium]